MDAPHSVLAVFILLELDAVPFQSLHHGETTGGGLINGALVDDSVVGAGDLGDVVLGCGLAGDDGVVDAVHAHGQRTGVPDVGLLEQQDLRTVLGGGERGHRSGRAATDHEHVAVEAHGVFERRNFH